ncbi:hypothetical protein LCGC14_1827790 [marine sediment metagenome]|uniref:Uncharacterized protein n=1 Tax=marine sediment metagenome TaxID=412755 RepID=A0A0F9GGY1_9ZZZZ
MTDEQILAALKSDTPLNRARQVFSSETARIEQTFQQRFDPPTPIEVRGMEFEAVKKIAAALDVDLILKAT